MARLTEAQRFWAKVDKSGECWFWTACKLPKGYGRFGVGGDVVLAHRWAYAEANGGIPDGMHVDHTCYNPSCVRPSHLRAVTPKQNLENRAGLSRNNTSGARGVSFHKKTGMWRAAVKHRRETVFSQTFETFEEAAEAARLARLGVFTHNDADRAA